MNNAQNISANIQRIQCDWEEDFRLIGKSSFWVSYTNKNAQNDYGKVTVVTESDGSISSCAGEGGFEVSAYDFKFHWIKITSPDKTLTTWFQSPNQKFTAIHPPKKSVNSIDISPKGELGISGGDNGVLKIWDTLNGEVQRNLVGHVGDVLVSKFFPSGEVALSSGSDVWIRIWSVLEGTCAATLKGHSAGVLDVAMIDRGRNLVSVSRDGTIILWETGNQTAITTWGGVADASSKNSCAICSNAFFNVNLSTEKDAREYGTEGKLLVVACGNSSFRGYDLRSKAQAFQATGKAELTSCGCLSDRYFLTGDKNGIISIWDAKQTSNPICNIARASAAITAIKPVTADRFWASTADGMCFLWDVTAQQSIKDLTGPDYDLIPQFAVHSDLLITACRDGILRKYIV